jgi:hypothetical protein
MTRSGEGRTTRRTGRWAAAFARELHDQGNLALDSAQLDLLAAALDDYPPRTSDDATIGAAWDSCRIAVSRVHCVIGSSCLSTEAAKRGRG